MIRVQVANYEYLTTLEKTGGRAEWNTQDEILSPLGVITTNYVYVVASI